MRIDRVEIREIHLRLVERFEISSGWVEDRKIVLLRLFDGDHVGWGECVAGESPNYSYETLVTSWHVLSRFLIPAIVGREFTRPEDILGPLAWVRGHRMAKAALEMAAWDLESKRNGVSLLESIGGMRRRIPVGVSIGLQETDDALYEKVEGYLEQGYQKIKIKIKPGRDVDMLAGLKRRFDGIPLMADANAAYTLADTSRLKELDSLDLMMIEQPLAFDDLQEHARLQSQLNTPICLDESIRSVRDAKLALHLGSGRIINIKPGRVGGLGEARKIHDLCETEGIPVWCGGMLESGIGRAHNVALATLPGFVIPGDISASRRYWERDIVDPEFEVVDGTVAPPRGPGIGVTPDLAHIEQITQRVESFEP